MVFTVRDGLLISSIMYRIRKEGRAIRIKMMAGRMVQIVSSACAFVVPFSLKRGVSHLWPYLRRSSAALLRINPLPSLFWFFYSPHLGHSGCVDSGGALGDLCFPRKASGPERGSVR